MPGVEAAYAFGDRLHLRLAEGASSRRVARQVQALARKQPDLSLHNIREIRPGLEDVFLHILAHQEANREPETRV